MILADLHEERETNPMLQGCDLAYDATQRVVWRCTSCGLPPGSCDHHGRVLPDAAFRHLATPCNTGNSFHAALSLQQTPRGGFVCEENEHEHLAESGIEESAVATLARQGNICTTSLSSQLAAKADCSGTRLLQAVLASFSPFFGITFNPAGELTLQEAAEANSTLRTAPHESLVWPMGEGLRDEREGLRDEREVNGEEDESEGYGESDMEVWEATPSGGFERKHRPGRAGEQAANIAAAAVSAGGAPPRIPAGQAQQQSVPMSFASRDCRDTCCRKPSPPPKLPHGAKLTKDMLWDAVTDTFATGRLLMWIRAANEGDEGEYNVRLGEVT